MLFLFFFCLFFSPIYYSQSDSIDCEQLYIQLTEHSRELWVEKMATPTGGLESIHKNLIYPKEALKNNIEGIVFVLVIIDSLGNLLCPKVLKGIGYGCDEEAVRVVSISRFTPTIHRGKAMTIAINIPVTFKLTP